MLLTTMSNDTIVITILCSLFAICLVFLFWGTCRKAGLFKDCCKDVKHSRDAVPSSSTSYGQLQLVV